VTACGLVDMYQVRFQASTAVVRTLFCILTWRGFVVFHRCFGTACQSHFQGSVSNQLLKYYSIHQSLIIIRLATCFDPSGSSSGLHYEPINIRKLRTFLEFQTMFTKDEHESFVSSDLQYVTNFIAFKTH